MSTRSNLETVLADGRFALTAEVVPPLAASPDKLLEEAEPLRGLADAVNITDGAAARTTMSSFAASALLAQAGLEPVLQVTCRDRNRIALSADLIGAAAQGIINLLILTGDDPSSGDQPDAKAVHDLDSRGLMDLARRMRDEGKLPSDREIEPPPHFFIGAADLPIDPEPDWQPKGLQAKIEAGASFVQTQLCWDLELTKRYAARLVDTGITEKLSILLGIGPIASARSAIWMRENLYGVQMPDAIIKRLEGASDPKAEGLAVCVELVQALADVPGIAGAHLMAPLQGAGAIAKVIAEVKR